MRVPHRISFSIAIPSAIRAPIWNLALVTALGTSACTAEGIVSQPRDGSRVEEHGPGDGGGFAGDGDGDDEPDPGEGDADRGGGGGDEGDEDGDGEPGEEPGACGEPTLPLAAGDLPRCTAQTRQCVESCTGAGDGDDADPDACLEACLTQDGSAPGGEEGDVDCETCVWIQVLACADRDGCHDALAGAACCEEQRCAGDADCETECAAEADAGEACLFDVTPHCLDLLAGDAAGCFAADGGGR